MASSRILIYTLLLPIASSGLSPALAAGDPTPPASCRDLYAGIHPNAPLFQAGAANEAAILLGEAPREYGAARRDLTKQFTAKPELAGETARALQQRGLAAFGSPGATLLALDVLGKAAPDLFVEAARGILTKPLPASLRSDPAKMALFKTQLGSRLLGQLAIFSGAQALPLADLMARSPWIRKFVGEQHNAARTLINLKNSIAPEVASTPAGRAKLAAVRVLANEWIEPRCLETLAKHYTMSDLPETDWAFSVVLAQEMARFFKEADPVAAKNFADRARELRAAEVPAAFRQNQRVKDLFQEFKIAD